MGRRRVTTKGARGATTRLSSPKSKAEKPMRAIPVFFAPLVLFVVIPLRVVWRAGLV